MEPYDHKDYPQAYMPNFQFQNENQALLSGNYAQMPNQSVPGMQIMSGPQQMASYYAHPQPQNVFPPSMPMNPAQDPNSKGKRKSKNEPEGRNFKCKQCDRTYLSYPALYTHIKTKHTVVGSGPPQTGRGKGRPRKIVF